MEHADFTIQVWVRLDALPWEENQDQTVFSLIKGREDVVTVYIDKNGNLKADSATTKLSIGRLDEKNKVVEKRWYKITLKSSSTSSKSVLSIGSYFVDQIDAVSRSSTIPSSGLLSFDSIRLGANFKNQNQLTGCLKHFYMLEEFLDEDQVRALSFNQVFPSDRLLIDLPLQNATALHLPTLASASLLNRKTELVYQEFDFGPSANCFVPGISKNLLKFDGVEIGFKQHLSYFPDTATISLWFYRTAKTAGTIIERSNGRLSAKFVTGDLDILQVSVNSDTTVKYDLASYYNTWINLVAVYKTTS